MKANQNDDESMTTKEVMKALFKEFGGPKAVADYFDISLARVYTFTDAAFPQNNIAFTRVARLTTPQSPAAARYLAQRAGGVFLPISTTKALSTMAAVSDAVREHGEAISGTLTAAADGKITPDEVPAVVKEIDEAFAALAALRSLVVQTARE